MKKLTIVAAFVATATQLSAQGIHFEQGNWKSVVAKAAKEHKLVYVDVYTPSLPPCLTCEVASGCFQLKEVGDKYNALFINYRVDATKGEGSAIAAKYVLHSYPAHLFINPANGALVYEDADDRPGIRMPRDTGLNAEVAGFIAQADIAMVEYKDPMTWAQYTTKFKAGKKDIAFLIAYLNKAHRLYKDAEAGSILDAYITAIGTTRPTDQQLRYIDEMTPGINNTAVAYLSTYKDRLQALHSNEQDYYQYELVLWMDKTFRLAVTTKDEALLATLLAAMKQYTPHDVAGIYSSRTSFYTLTGNTEKAMAAAAEEADYLTATPTEKYDMGTATLLNSTAWAVYQNQSTNTTAVTRALPWAKKAMDVTPETDESWATFADTYAHLLMVSGRKEEAIALEQKAADKLKALAAVDAAAYQETADGMKAGKL